MDIHKLTITVLDFDSMGAEAIRQTLEQQRYPNHCIAPQVMAVVTQDIGPWSDDHPLNKQQTAPAELARLFPEPAVPKLEPIEGDVLPAIGSRVFIRHGRDDAAHACTVTGYYAWGDLGGARHLHRLFVRLVYEGTDCAQARLLADCHLTAEAALAANGSWNQL